MAKKTPTPAEDTTLRTQREIQQTAQFGGVCRLAVLRRQRRTVMHGIEQAGQHESRKNHRGRHAAGAAADARPGRAKMRPGTGIGSITRNRRDQQPHQRIRPQQLHAESEQGLRRHEKRTRGSTSV